MSRFIISPDAIQDLEEITDYFLSRNIEAGDRFIEDFNKKCRNLAQFPSIGRSYKFIRSYLRGIPLDGYIIFYRVLDDGVEILRVVSARRDLESLFSDSDNE
ncbi:type II toxin-antitoxin system RelE/ParE family toxin [Iningainema tapete]|uniref:Type II toxin-antitoxin system RelE/ParE family toxin n=1 Tax=Iningainema tapete BLCC-T55 TaxID=2748662 RepID=A0A8J7BWD9_9CYAN|nr:type II toxin-antitoxin system RelE/ParE family toxin [Iningainema tapete]MBD2770748.1 type II toxin-antitoxin system RelE/ParE family toxin [Iningainema tapete BLCC-T55]